MQCVRASALLALIPAAQNNHFLANFAKKTLFCAAGFAGVRLGENCETGVSAYVRVCISRAESLYCLHIKKVNREPRCALQKSGRVQVRWL